MSETDSQKADVSGGQTVGLAHMTGRMLGRAISGVFCFECLFLLFLFAGRYKAAEWLRWVPVDLTALFFCLSILSGYLVLRRRGFRVHRSALILVLLVLAFVAYAVLSLAWTPGQVYAREKAFYMATLTLWPLVACAFIVGHDRCRLRRFVLLLVVFSTWLATESIMAGMQYGFRGKISVLGGNYLGAGRTIGLGALSTLAFGLFFAQRRVEKALAVILLGFFAVTLSVLGGRAPFLAVIAGAAVPLVVGFRLPISVHLQARRYAVMLLVVSGVVIILAAGVILFADALPWTFARLGAMSLQSGGIAKRLSSYHVALQLWQQRPFEGHGVGSYAVLRTGTSTPVYPHNLILEILAELGLFGMLLFAAVVRVALKALGPPSAIRDDPWKLLVAMLFANTLFNAMVGGDIPDNRVVFAALGLMTLTRHDSRATRPQPLSHAPR